MAESNLQMRIESARRYYSGLGQTPLLEQLTQIHGITQREFAAILGVSKQHSENLLKHKVLPSLELALKIARYFECTVEDLFGWRVDDGGERRPLLIKDPETGEVRRLNAAGKRVRALELIRGEENESLGSNFDDRGGGVCVGADTKRQESGS
jgi:putative transcriptional regulator